MKRLDQHRAQDLRPRGAEHAQQRELLRALGDGDRERVEDQEAADEQRDAGEDEQRRADEAERVGEVLRLLLGRLLAGADEEVAGPSSFCSDALTASGDVPPVETEIES